MSNIPIPLASQLESLLLFKGGAVPVAELVAALHVSETEVLEALEVLRTQLQGRGIRLVEEGKRVALGTAPETKALIESVRRDELEGQIGRAGLETLAVIIYQGPVSRADIEYVRGVNVSTTLRSLLMRGLIERIDHPTDARSFQYRITPELVAYFGLSRIDELPNYAAVQAELNALRSAPAPGEEQ
jgi:segregation and condensation protein B